LRPALGLHRERRDGGVIENAIAGAMIPESMMGPACKTDGQTLLQRATTRLDCCTAGTARTLDHLW